MPVEKNSKASFAFVYFYGPVYKDTRDAGWPVFKDL
jgi:hypothetical protein